MVWVALEAARQLKDEGIELEVLDLRTLCPLGRAAVLATVRRTNKVLLLHEDNRTGGLAAELSASICEEASNIWTGPLCASRRRTLRCRSARRWKSCFCRTQEMCSKPRARLRHTEMWDRL